MALTLARFQFVALVTVVMASISCMPIHAQAPIGELRAVTSGSFTMKVPVSWREMKMRGEGPVLYFSAGGRDGLPVAYNDGPLIVTVFVETLDFATLDECRESVLRGYTQNPDRVFESDSIHRVVPMSLASGDTAYSISTRFYRTSKGLYQNRYDLAVYSSKAKLGYLVTLSIQHNDKSYALEQELGFREYVDRVFRTVDVD